MAEIIRMPKMSDTMEEGVIAGWLKKVGDDIKSGDILAEVETDKATMELESYDDGILLHIGVNDGDSVPVDGVIAIIGEKDENIDEILSEIASEVNISIIEEKKTQETKDIVDEEKVEEIEEVEDYGDAIDEDGLEGQHQPQISETTRLKTQHDVLFFFFSLDVLLHPEA